MPAVTQRINNYLGGVSRQSDDKKRPGQVRECLNAYPDPTFGLTKRPGLKWIKNIGTGTTYDSARWFYIHRDNDEKYIGCIKPSSITVSTVTGENGTSGATNKTGVAVTGTSGSGTGMTVDLTATSGVVTGIVINKPGVGYKEADTITISAANAGTGTDVKGTLTLGDIDIWNTTDGTECDVYYDAPNPSNWAQSTLYEVGDYVKANNKLYKCTRKGMSNSSGTGPSATTTNIEYLPLWAANTDYSVNDKVVANGNVYKCDQAGYSDKRTEPWSGPSSTGLDIVDPDTLNAWRSSTSYAVGDLFSNDSGKVY